MPDNNSTIWAELVAAGRGVIAVIIGDRRAPSHFLLTQRGLVGSFIAFLTVAAVNMALPLVLGTGSGGNVLRLLISIALPFALQVGFSALALRQIGRLDALLPYIVVQNWVSAYISTVVLGLTLVGVPAEVLLLLFGILAIIVEINVPRLVLQFKALQIALLIVAQLVGGCIGLLLLLALLPAPPGAVPAGVF